MYSICVVDVLVGLLLYCSDLFCLLAMFCFVIMYFVLCLHPQLRCVLLMCCVIVVLCVFAFVVVCFMCDVPLCCIFL